MLLNLWDSEALTQSFMNLYDLTGRQMCNILRRLLLDTDHDIVKIFCEETEIKLDKVDVAHNIEFLGKIVSTTIDDCHHLRQFGLVPLDALLENDSPISRHLKKFQIEIRPSTHELFYKGKRLYIPAYQEDCEWCAYGDEQCRYSGQRYKDMCCTYLQAIAVLANKLYHDNCEIEMFLFAQKETMLNYSTVKDYPEIFCTIEDFAREYFKADLDIGRDWSKHRQRSFIITVPINYGDMSYRNGYIDRETDADRNETFWHYEDFCGGIYDHLEQIPQCFWDNVWLIDVCLRLIRSFRETSEICAGIKHDTIIPYDRLKIDLFIES